MLNDRQLENLVRMAAEIEAMEALASGKPSLRLTGGGAPVSASKGASHGWRLGWRRSAAFGSMLAAAAAIAFVAMPGGLLSGSKTSPSPRLVPHERIAKAPAPVNPEIYTGPGGVWPAALPWPLNGEPVDPLAQARRSPEIRGALLAILEDDAGRVESVKWVEHDWEAGKGLDDAKASDLVALSLMMSSDHTPRQMTVVGLRGPADELPLGDARAQELASCIVRAPAKCSSMSCCNPGAAVECIPDDVSVRFERVSFR